MAGMHGGMGGMGGSMAGMGGGMAGMHSVHMGGMGGPHTGMGGGMGMGLGGQQALISIAMSQRNASERAAERHAQERSNEMVLMATLFGQNYRPF